MSKSFPDTSNQFASLLEKVGLSPTEAAEKLEVSNRTIYRWINGESKPQPMALKTIKIMAETANSSLSTRQAEFRYIDLFAGIGGFRKAFDSINGQCVFTSEWDKNSRLTYQANYECDHEVVGDIREFTQSESTLRSIPEHDVLVAGFPCQPFSIAGVSKKNSLGKAHGFKCDTQGTLFFDLAQIIEYHKPSVFLLENVKNLMSHDGGNTFKIIKRTLEEELQYKIECRVIDARNWVPQHRERIFIVGFRQDVGFRFSDFNIPEENPSLTNILHDKNEEDEAPFFEFGRVSSKYTLTPRLWEYLVEYKKRHKAKGNGFGFSLFGPDNVARTLSARYYKDGSEILIEQKGERPRRLTPRECSRLMGFDKPGESYFKIPVSETQAYRQFGNAVVVPVAEAIAQKLRPYIKKAISVSENQLRIPLGETALA
ncbi:MAG: DNA (cytosine-5-)-methyltransferase [Cyclobacteriaceae bacterium]